jgi:subtilisin family serine protease
VKPRAGVDLSTLHQRLGVRVHAKFSAIGNLEVIEVPAASTADMVIKEYQQSGLIQYAEHDYTVQALNDPNDYFYQQGNLWNFKNLGQYGGVPGADIRAPIAWNTITSAADIIVAVVDTGVRYTHEDLAANMWVNPLDGSHGTNVVAGNSNPWDDYGHGSHVSGIIGAVGNNSVGVVGVCWRVQLMACKFLDSNGIGTISGAVTCIDYARDHGAKVINASWGSFTFTSQALHDAIASAGAADVIFVAAAGNSGANNDVTPLYPASYSDLDNVVSVAATDNYDKLPGWSDYGTTNVDLAAPGMPIFSCWNGSDSDYEWDNGTSMACAHVTGACALLRAFYPNENHQQIIQQILIGTDPLPALIGKCKSGGRLDLPKALGVVSIPPLASPATTTAGYNANPSSGQVPLTVQFTDASTGAPASWNWNFGDGGTSGAQNPSHVYNSAGNFTATLTIRDSSGNTSSKSGTITATNPPPPLVAGFKASPTSGKVPLTVQFTDQSRGNPVSWNWSFGDGSANSSTQNPAHTYKSVGNFTATLTVTGGTGQASSKSETITVKRH